MSISNLFTVREPNDRHIACRRSFVQCRMSVASIHNITHILAQTPNKNIEQTKPKYLKCRSNGLNVGQHNTYRRRMYTIVNCIMLFDLCCEQGASVDTLNYSIESSYERQGLRRYDDDDVYNVNKR